jgi:hypothetical protein
MQITKSNTYLCKLMMSDISNRTNEIFQPELVLNKINNISTVVSIDINVNKTGKIIFEDINNFSEEDIYSNISYTYNKEMKVYEALGEKYTFYLYIIKEL